MKKLEKLITWALVLMIILNALSVLYLGYLKMTIHIISAQKKGLEMELMQYEQ